MTAERSVMYNKTESEISLANKMKQNCDNDPALSHNNKVITRITDKTIKNIIVFILLLELSWKKKFIRKNPFPHSDLSFYLYFGTNSRNSISSKAVIKL